MVLHEAYKTIGAISFNAKCVVQNVPNVEGYEPEPMTNFAFGIGKDLFYLTKGIAGEAYETLSYTAHLMNNGVDDLKDILSNHDVKFKDGFDFTNLPGTDAYSNSVIRKQEEYKGNET